MNSKNQRGKALTKKNLSTLRKQGLTYKEIAQKLHFSTSAVYYHFRRLHLVKKFEV